MEEDEEAIGTGITFKVGGAGDRGGGDQGPEETDPSNPNCYAWCLINVCVSKILQQTIRKIVAGVGMEVLGEDRRLLTGTESVLIWNSLESCGSQTEPGQFFYYYCMT